MSKSILQRNVSLARALSKIGYTSRKQAERSILEGRVKVNGKIILNPSYRCSISRDKILVDGEKLQQKKLTYVIMNKPVGVLTTRSDEKGRKTVYDLVGDSDKWIYPVGRLDKDTAGLLLFTNDHQLGERLTNPQSKIPKTYRVDLDKPFQVKDVLTFKKGMVLDGKQLLPAKVEVLKGDRIEIIITEGKNRQIRRMCEALGYEILSLTRIRIGSLEITDLKPGEWRYLTRQEINSLSIRRKK